ncbi:TIM-barrel domain-containing protein, partial [Escherichia coli]|uniref:TIM-barrel domain-containing protein n=1 Tax=Escherichia coli TaxID=562 RepID=UPI0027D25F09
ETFWCNYVFFNEAAKRDNHRPVIFHRWGGLGSHRYQIGFSGDANISYEALAFEPYFTATASNVGYGYWGHDLGGHMFSNEELVNNPNLVLRWIQFGVFTPIFRTHATSDSRIERRIWNFSH